MAVYTVKLLTLTVTTNSGATYTITDTVDCPYASQALNEIKSGRPFYVSTEDGEYLVMGTAVESVRMVYADSEEQERADPFCEGE